MNATFGRFILSAEAITPSGMNLDISLCVAKADLGRFDKLKSDDPLQGYTAAKIDFLKEGSALERHIEMITTLGLALLSPLISALKPLPLFLSVPDAFDARRIKKSLENNPLLTGLGDIKITHEGGARFVFEALQLLDTHDILMCIAVDSLFENSETYISDATLFSGNNPWGIIPSEGGAGVIFVKKNRVDVLKLKPLAKLEYFDIEKDSKDRRAMMRLVRKASKSVPFFGSVYSNMTTSRQDSEDYGFALGTKGELFTNPQEPFLINELWGTMGAGAALALLAVFTAEHRSKDPGSLLMFEQNGDRGFLNLRRCF